MGVKFGVNPALLSDFFARNIKTHEMEALSKGGRNGYHMLGFVKRNQFRLRGRIYPQVKCALGVIRLNLHGDDGIMG